MPEETDTIVESVFQDSSLRLLEQQIMVLQDRIRGLEDGLTDLAARVRVLEDSAVTLTAAESEY